MPFVPQRIFFEEGTLDYPMGKRIHALFKDKPGLTITFLKNKQRIARQPGIAPDEFYRQGKRTLIVGIRKTLAFQSCKPSAHYQLPLVTGCMGQCEYCYLNTQFGKNPYIRVYVNLDEILQQTAHYIDQRKPDMTLFEGAATSDPVPVEPYTESLRHTIEFFSGQTHAKFRFVTKYTDIDSLLSLDHQGKTTIRFSINAQSIIHDYEHATPPLQQRLQAAAKIADAGYPLGFIIGPVILFEGWETAYREMFAALDQQLKDRRDILHFEVISHRFTARAKNTILSVYPASSLPMDEQERKFKYGQFGYGKYLYKPEQMAFIRDYFSRSAEDFFPESKIDYII